jgi:hypothetical protein
MPVGQQRKNGISMDRNLKLACMIMGSIYSLGLLWFGEYYFNISVLYSILLVTTGISLIVTPWIYNVIIGYKIIRIGWLVILILGTVSVFIFIIYNLIKIENFGLGTMLQLYTLYLMIKLVNIVKKEPLNPEVLAPEMKQ